jgi:hypothetical protein
MKSRKNKSNRKSNINKSNKRKTKNKNRKIVFGGGLGEMAKSMGAELPKNPLNLKPPNLDGGVNALPKNPLSNLKMPELGNLEKGLDMKELSGLKNFGLGAMKMQKGTEELSIIKQVGSSIAFLVGNIVGFPFKHIEQIIPENVCKDYISNPALCNQNMKEFLFTGTKKDFGKLLSEEDRGQCLELDDMNHIVKCKRKKMSLPSMLDLAQKGIQKGGAPDKVKKAKSFKYDCTGTTSKNGKLGNNSEKNVTPKDVKGKIFFRRKANLEHIRKRLVHLNLLLRKYQCPRDKLKSIINRVKDKEMLIKIKDILVTLMKNTSQYKKSKDADESLKNRKMCDDLYNQRFIEPTYEAEEYGLKILPDVKHIRFTTSLIEMLNDSKCDGCSPWDVLMDKYTELVYYSMMGDKKSIYILVNFLHDIIVIKKYEKTEDNGLVDDVFDDIRYLLENIQCRSDVIGILDELIAKL